jgi:Tol biopolymer transport system component
MMRAWVRYLVAAGLAAVAGAAAGCAGDTTGPTPLRRPELVFAEVDTGTFTTRLMGYSAHEGVWELAPGEANLPQPTQYWHLQPTTGEVLYSGVLADLARGTYTPLSSPTLDAIGPVHEWAPTGERLLVVLLDGESYGLLDARTWTLTGLTLPRRPDCSLPSFTPDGQAVTQACRPDATAGSKYDVFRWPVAGGDPTNLTQTPGLDEHGWRYSPDMQRVVFYRSGLLFVANADGFGARSVYDSAYGSVAWSPDGQRVAVRATVDGVLGIAILPLDGTARLVTPPTASGGGTNSVWWSPDGTRLAYDAFDEAGDGELSLFVINTDGTGLRRINRAGRFANIAAWYPPSAP